MAQVGTQHGHAAGKVAALRASPDVDFRGVWEPDAARREQLQRDGGPWAGVHWFATEEELLGDGRIVAVASEGVNAESLAQTTRLLEAGKHVWYDKPAGEDWPGWQRAVATAQARGLHLQMGYMFRYHEGFRRVAEWAAAGWLGEVFAVRAHMSTHITAAQRERIAVHRGGIFYDLAGHMLDQIVALLGRPSAVTAFLRHDDALVPGFADNTLAVLSYPRALATVDIAAMETPPSARRYEVYGTQGSAILLEPFEPGERLRLCLDRPREGYAQGENILSIPAQLRQTLYERELVAWVATLRGEQAPERSFAHDLLVQETLLRCTGVLS
jgi:predicted dehydrogenase